MSEGGFSLIKFEGKALEKLIDTISSAVGFFVEPIKTKRATDAEAYNIITLAKAQATARHGVEMMDQEFVERLNNRVLISEINKQVNIEAISAKAADILKLEDSVDEEPVDPDWTNRFFKHIEDISDDQMQFLWAKILAGEVKQPGSFSLRTLDAIKNITKKDADLIMHAFKYVVNTKSDAIICNFGDTKYLKKFNITYNDVLYLVELGILLSNDTLSNTILTTDDVSKGYYFTKDKILFYEKNGGTPTVRLMCYVVTKMGADLYRISEVESDVEALTDIAKYLNSNQMKVTYSEILERIGNEISYGPSKSFSI